MSIVQHNGVAIRELVINPSYVRKNSYNLFYSNMDTTVDENSVSFSQLINTATQKFNKLISMIPDSANSKYRNQFVLGRATKNSEAQINLAIPGSGGVDVFQNWMESSPMYFGPSTP